MDPMFVLLVVLQVIVFLVLATAMFVLVRVIKAQNNNRILPPDISQRLRRLFGRPPR